MSVSDFQSENSTLLEDETPSRVLVCDDSEDTRNIIRATLEAMGHAVVEAEHGEAALEICEQELPDVIVLDVMMPVMSGTEFLKIFRTKYEEPFVPVMMVTALSEVENRVEGLEIGADDYLGKPFNARELQARVAALLRTKRLTARLHQRTRELQEMQEALVAKERELVAMQIAGTASHRLKQPIQSILLNCHLIKQATKRLDDHAGKPILDGINVIQTECNSLNDTLVKLEKADPNQTTEYVGSVEIIELDGDKGETADNDN